LNLFNVIPVKAGIYCTFSVTKQPFKWIPAYAGMTAAKSFAMTENFLSLEKNSKLITKY